MSSESYAPVSPEAVEVDVGELMFLIDIIVAALGLLLIAVYGKSNSNRGALVMGTVGVASLNAFAWWLIRNQ